MPNIATPAPAPDDPPMLTAEQFEQLTRMALYPGEGDVLPFGTRTLAREYVSIDTEQAITNRVLALAHTYPGATLAEVFAVAQAELVEMAAWILADYDAPEGAEPDTGAAEAWIRSRRNKVTTAQIVSLVLGQVELHDQVAILGKALMASGLFESLAAALTPTLPATSSAMA